MDSQNITLAKKVLETEIEGIRALENALDHKFDDAVESILELQGKLVLSGMGKSGHIARKIAATFASTGTPAIFVHPGEASHGDLGMISKGDICILLSNSGETSELKDIIFYCKRFSIPIIAMVRRESSTLVDAADIAFVLPDTPEASPAVSAPTTSTTMMLAWGDALSMTVMQRKGFGKDEFGIYHPGGKLGSQFITVSQIMKKGKDLPIVQSSDKMTDVLIEMTKKSLGCAIVVDDNKIVGIITDGDLRRHMETDILKQTAKDIANLNPKTIKPSMLAVEALGIMNTKSITCLTVADENGTLKGVLHIHQILSAGIS